MFTLDGSSSFIYLVLLISTLSICLQQTQAYENGAESCETGAALGDILTGPGGGELSEGGFQLTLSGNTLEPGFGPGNTFTPNEPLVLGLVFSAPTTYNGFLIRVGGERTLEGGETVATEGELTTLPTTPVKISEVCVDLDPPIAGVTNIDDGPKSDPFSILFNAPASRIIDVTVVVGQQWYHSSYEVEVVTVNTGISSVPSSNPSSKPSGAKTGSSAPSAGPSLSSKPSGAKTGSSAPSTSTKPSSSSGPSISINPSSGPSISSKPSLSSKPSKPKVGSTAPSSTPSSSPVKAAAPVSAPDNSAAPSSSPSSSPSNSPSSSKGKNATPEPTYFPTSSPTSKVVPPTSSPSSRPSSSPSKATVISSSRPSSSPSSTPSKAKVEPTSIPTFVPTGVPVKTPTNAPPTNAPPTNAPPTNAPPTNAPPTNAPPPITAITLNPSSNPSAMAVAANTTPTVPPIMNSNTTLAPTISNTNNTTSQTKSCNPTDICPPSSFLFNSKLTNNFLDKNDNIMVSDPSEQIKIRCDRLVERLSQNQTQCEKYHTRTVDRCCIDPNLTCDFCPAGKVLLKTKMTTNVLGLGPKMVKCSMLERVLGKREESCREFSSVLEKRCCRDA